MIPKTKSRSLPIPEFFDPDKVGEVWRVYYQERAETARVWADQHGIPAAEKDKRRVTLMLVDVQNTFCLPGFELFVGGRSGMAAVDDNRRLCEFIYRNLDCITDIAATMDTHQAMQIFHSIFLVDKNGNHPPPFSLVSAEQIEKGEWRFNTDLCSSLNVNRQYGEQYLKHYASKLKESGKYDLTIWPYHAMLGGIGHALVSAVEEAVFFHSIARYTQPDFQVKGNNPFTENYSVLSPEVVEDHTGEMIGARNANFLQKLMKVDALIIAGQAKSHCVAWTIADFLQAIDSAAHLTSKVYLLEDCMSPVVIPGAIDYTEQADAAFRRFADAGMHIVRSTDPIESWPGFKK